MWSEFTSNSIPSGLLWHYTDFKGLQGILMERKFWASDIKYLNDTAEFNLTIGLVERTLEELQKSHLLIDVATWTTALGGKSYVTCFSKELDDLSQWRAYAHTPPGFALGFERVVLEHHAAQHDFRLVDCEYRRETHERTIREILEGYLSEMIPPKEVREEWKRLQLPHPERFRRVASALADAAVRFKAPQFKSESEVRAVYPPTSGTSRRTYPMKFRQSRSLIMPYIEWNTEGSEPEDRPLRYILVGPGPHQTQVAQAVKDMCADAMDGVVKVGLSAIPYRNW